MMPARGIDLSKSWADQVEEEEEAATPIVTATHENTEIEEPSTAIELAHAWPLSAATEPSAAETAAIANPARGPPLPLMPKFAMPTAAEQCEPHLPLSVRLRGGGTEDELRHASAHGQEGGGGGTLTETESDSKQASREKSGNEGSEPESTAGQAPCRNAELKTQPDPSAHQKRARETDFDDEGADAAEQQVVKRPKSGSVSGEVAMSESDGG